MARYQKVLLALDFHDDNTAIIEKGKEVIGDNSAETFLIHVNEPLTAAYAGNGMNWNEQIVALEASIRKESQKKMLEVAEQLGVPNDNCAVREGKASAEIHELCKEKGIDLVVMGTHGQSGLQLLLGSTANSVLHGSPCDVLCVRVGK